MHMQTAACCKKKVKQAEIGISSAFTIPLFKDWQKLPDNDECKLLRGKWTQQNIAGQETMASCLYNNLFFVISGNP